MVGPVRPPQRARGRHMGSERGSSSVPYPCSAHRIANAKQYTLGRYYPSRSQPAYFLSSRIQPAYAMSAPTAPHPPHAVWARAGPALPRNQMQ
eukprot:3544447-Rhodomonas_salina.3